MPEMPPRAVWQRPSATPLPTVTDIAFGIRSTDDRSDLARLLWHLLNQMSPDQVRVAAAEARSYARFYAGMGGFGGFEQSYERIAVRLDALALLRLPAVRLLPCGVAEKTCAKPIISAS